MCSVYSPLTCTLILNIALTNVSFCTLHISFFAKSAKSQYFIYINLIIFVNISKENINIQFPQIVISGYKLNCIGLMYFVFDKF